MCLVVTAQFPVALGAAIHGAYSSPDVSVQMRAMASDCLQ